MQWKSLEDIQETLQLDVDPRDSEAVRTAILRARDELHPDRSGGNFATDSDRERYYQLNEALEFCNKPAANAITLKSGSDALLAILQETVEHGRDRAISDQRAEYRQLFQSEQHQRIMLPRIGSGVFAAISAALVTFSGQLKTNPIFGGLFDSLYARSMLMEALVLSGVLFFFTWWREQKLNARSEWLSTDEGGRAILAETIEESNRPDPENQQITFSGAVNAILSLDRGRSLRYRRQWSPWNSLTRATGMTRATAEKLAHIHLDELERRGVLKRVAGAHLDPTYKFDSSIINELLSAFTVQNFR